MEFCEKEEIRQFVSIPDATELLQLLDQCFGNLHRAYTEEKDNLFDGDHVSREGFMTVLASIINTWISEDIILKAASRVGITKDGISIHNLQKDKFARVEAITNTPCAPSTTQEPRQESPTKLGLVKLGLNVPNHVRAGSKEFYKESCKLLLRHANTPVDTEEISEMLNVVKKEKPGPSKATRLTQVHGSLTGKAILSKVKQINEEKERKEDAAMAKKLLKEKKVTAFIRCEIRCVCEKDQLIAGKCAADGLRKCSVCGSILKGDCTKKIAKLPAAPPFILHPQAKEEKFETLLMQRIMEKKKLLNLMILI